LLCHCWLIWVTETIYTRRQNRPSHVCAVSLADISPPPRCANGRAIFHGKTEQPLERGVNGTIGSTRGFRPGDFPGLRPAFDLFGRSFMIGF
jgi:hypothetical protein